MLKRKLTDLAIGLAAVMLGNDNVAAPGTLVAVTRQSAGFMFKHIGITRIDHELRIHEFEGDSVQIG